MASNEVISFYSDATITFKGRDKHNDWTIIFTWPDGAKHYSSVGRFLLEKKENRFLRRNEYAIFLDGNHNNFSLENLAVFKRQIPQKIFPKEKEVTFFWRRKEIILRCLFCEHEKILPKDQMNMFIWRRRVSKKDGPFCNAKCYQSWLTAKSLGKKVAMPPSFDFLTYVQFRKEFNKEPILTGKTVTLPFNVPFKPSHARKYNGH